MTASGLISIESHTYDMHQWPPFETGDRVRDTILPFEDESEADYMQALTQDIEKQNELFATLSLLPSDVLSFPKGAKSDLANAILKSSGYKVTVSNHPDENNTLVAGLPQSLLNLGRLTMDEGASEEDMLFYLNNLKKR